MKNLMILILLCTVVCCTPKEQTSQKNTPESSDQMGYDSLLAEQLGADEYGMKRYVMAFLKRGPNRDRSEQEAIDLQNAHMANIERLAEEGKLIVAGPFLDDGDIRGIYIFDVESIDEAEELTASDPAIQAGSLVMELHPWYGSAALMETSALHTRISKTEF